MRKSFSILVLSLFLSVGIIAQNNNQYNGKTEKVRVFFNQAQIEKSLSFDLKKGSNEIILVGNSQYLNTNSLQFLTSGDYIIMDFSPYMQYVNPIPEPEDKLPLESRKKLKTLRDSLEILNYYYSELTTFVNILNQERNAISSMKVITQPQNIDSLAKLKDGLEYYRSKMLEVTSLLQKKNKEVVKVSNNISEINSQINLIVQGNKPKEMNRNEYFIKLNIYAENPIIKAGLKYNYLVNNVSWQPVYDLKFTSTNSPARFVLKANITQNTGENWNDVNLIFSTEQPNLRKTLGVLNPYYLQEYSPSRNHKAINTVGGISASEDAAFEVSAKAARAERAYYNNSAYTEMTTTQTTMLGKEYEVGMKHSIESDGKQKTIPLETKKTNADYKHYSIPKLDRGVYISALLPNWEELEIMDATAKIYLDNNYINDTYLNSFNTEDTLNLSIGQDNRVAIERKVDKSKPEKTNILGNVVETKVTITLKIKNNNQESIDLNIQDQIPISNNEDIKITQTNTGNAKYDEKTGKLVWDLNLKTLEQRVITFSYTVRHPKGINIFLN